MIECRIKWVFFKRLFLLNGTVQKRGPKGAIQGTASYVLVLLEDAHVCICCHSVKELHYHSVRLTQQTSVIRCKQADGRVIWEEVTLVLDSYSWALEAAWSSWQFVLPTYLRWRQKETSWYDQSEDISLSNGFWLNVGKCKMLPHSITTLLKFEQSLTSECCVGFPTTWLSTDFHCQMTAKASLFGRNPIYL